MPKIQIGGKEKKIGGSIWNPLSRKPFSVMVSSNLHIYESKPTTNYIKYLRNIL